MVLPGPYPEDSVQKQAIWGLLARSFQEITPCCQDSWESSWMYPEYSVYLRDVCWDATPSDSEAAFILLNRPMSI